MDEYDSGITIVRVNLDKADPPAEVINSFREVQAAEQERDRLQRQADAYANRVLAEARGEAAQILEQAEGYRAQVVNQALGEASRFTAVLVEYEKAEDVTRNRLYIETMERVLGQIDKTILDSSIVGGEGGQGDAPDAERLRRQVGERVGDGERVGQEQERPHTPESGWDIPWVEVATRFCRVDDGLPAWVHARRVARLKALGNAIVPQVAHEICKAIAEIERGEKG
jgi:vacuolar-type H+-ATPase subunit H